MHVMLQALNDGAIPDASIVLRMREEAGVDLDEMARRTGMAASVLWGVERGEAGGMLGLLPDYCTASGKTFEISIRDAD